MVLRRTTPRVHGTASSYTNYGCRCSRCRAAWSTYNSGANPGRVSKDRYQARQLAAGNDANGRPRKKPYGPKAMELMARFGLAPDERFLP